MNMDLTELVFILDRSGSMGGLESDTIGGFNGMIDRQKKEEKEVNVTTILFDDEFGLKRNNKINLLASILYGYTTNHMQPLYGNVILQKRIDCVTGDILWGYTYREANIIKKRIREIKKDYRYKFLSNLIK